MLCVLILYISCWTYSLKSTPNNIFFGKLFMAILFYSQSFWQQSAEGKSPNKYFFQIFSPIWSLAIWALAILPLAIWPLAMWPLGTFFWPQQHDFSNMISATWPQQHDLSIMTNMAFSNMNSSNIASSNMSSSNMASVRFLRNFFMTILFTLRVFARNLPTRLRRH